MIQSLLGDSRQGKARCAGNEHSLVKGLLGIGLPDGPPLVKLYEYVFLA